MNPLRLRQFAIPIALLLLSIGGCETIEDRKSANLLEKVLSSYQNTVRWGDPERAFVFLKPDLFAEEPIPSDLDNARVTGYEVIRPPIALSEGLVKQTARISYVLKDRQIERNLIDEQTWEYQPEEKVWYRVNPIPEYK